MNNITYPSNPCSSHSFSSDRACPSYSVTIKKKTHTHKVKVFKNDLYFLTWFGKKQKTNKHMVRS